MKDLLVEKRNGQMEPFNIEKIENAIKNAMRETDKGLNEELAISIAKDVKKEVKKLDKASVENIQDLVETHLMLSDRKDVAKRYIIYRNEKSKLRVLDINIGQSKWKFLDDSFISKYKHTKPPMTNLGEFVFYRTYSRLIEEEGRREEWWETVRRAVEYNASLSPTTTKAEAQELYDNIFHLRQFPSGRTLWVGNTEVSKRYPLSNFNCAGIVLESIHDYEDLFYLLMVGAGVGVRITKDTVAKMEKVRSDIMLTLENYSPKSPTDRIDNASLEFINNTTARIIVGDSKFGWKEALRYYFDILTSVSFETIEHVIINFDNVRLKGERLKTFGGTAAGHIGILNMFKKIDKVIKNRASKKSGSVKLEPIDCLDIANIIGENVVSGGVRRTAEIALLDKDDKESIEAKNNLYYFDGEKFVPNEEIIHRSLSNNSIWYTEKPTWEEWKKHIETMRLSGEPGFINAEAGAKRRGDGRFRVVNPCAEILLDSHQTCNLSTINVFAFIKDGKLDREALLNAQRLSTRMTYRMTLPELELHRWNEAQNRDRLIGNSLTGWQDMVNELKLSRDEEIEILKALRAVSHEAGEQYAEELGLNKPLLITTVKPEGSLSQLPTVSSGVHHSHSPYYIRRVRISVSDPLLKVAEELEWPIFNEVGQNDTNVTTKVIEFPVKSPDGRTKYDVSAIEQLENYKMFMEHYVDHNVSITISVKDNEWDEVAEWVYENWDSCVALSFLSLDDNFYELAPYESIDEKEYNRRITEMKPFRKSLLKQFENPMLIFDLEDDPSCSTGVCPIR